MNLWQWAAVGVAASAIVGLASARESSGNGEDMTTRQQRRSRLVGALDLLPLTATQRAFLVFTALGESGWNPRAHNGTASERLSAARGAANLPEQTAERIAACGLDVTVLETGSWGLFQRLAPYVASDAIGVFGAAACPFVDPSQMDYAWQICSAIYTAGRLQRYVRFTSYPTVGNLRLGWYGLVAMGYLSRHADRIERYRRQARDAGYAAAIVDDEIERFPTNVTALYQILSAGGYAVR